MRIAEPKPNTFPMVVDDSRLIQKDAEIVVDGSRYWVAGIDDATSTLFVRPLGKRRERRAAVRKVFT